MPCYMQSHVKNQGARFYCVEGPRPMRERDCQGMSVEEQLRSRICFRRSHICGHMGLRDRD